MSVIESKDFAPKDYIVFVRCDTYNHSIFIEEALAGFTKQKTSFPFSCVIIDDHSTDDSQHIVKEWIDKECDQNSIVLYDSDLFYLFVANHKKNTNCFFAFYLLKQNLYGDIRKEEILEPWRIHSKYEAICEGDDYWTYSNKLQEQVDFLEEHINYSATASNSLIYRGVSLPTNPFGPLINKDYYKLKDIVVKRQFHTASVVFRISSMRNCKYYKKGLWDTFKWCCLLSQGPIHYSSKMTCIYRSQQQGVTETTPTIKWLSLTSNWADIISDCFVPEYVKRKYVVRSVTRGVIGAYFANYRTLSIDDRRVLKELYLHNFMINNFFFDIQEFLKQCAKKLLGRN